ncbi:hypothetical protein LZ554_003027 [Drepanopeziza brunnea f. sp. 'monogermtubi']|nr:hypothetical protein LZ554_003027 [Drepanopeziza brunnea f. sp. 'monogermtubi']
MLFHILTAILIGSGLGVAQTVTSTSSAPSATHTVSVGADGFNFSPNELVAKKGDIIEYRFYPQNHSVARAAFGNEPCIPYELTGPGRIGFYSGFRPTVLVTNNPPIFRLKINDTDPLFFYCSAPGACLEGMVGVVNPNATHSYANQFAYSQNATLEFSPGEYFPVESKISRTTTATGATSTPTASSTSTAVPGKSPSTSLSGGAIAGIVIGALAIVLFASALLYMCGRQRGIGDLLRQHRQPKGDEGQGRASSYQPNMGGLSEAQYASLRKSPESDSFWGAGADAYKSLSPALLGGGGPGGWETRMGAFPPGYQGYQGVEKNRVYEMAGSGAKWYSPAPLRPKRSVRHELPGGKDGNGLAAATDSDAGGRGKIETEDSEVNDAHNF